MEAYSQDASRVETRDRRPPPRPRRTCRCGRARGGARDRRSGGTSGARGTCSRRRASPRRAGAPRRRTRACRACGAPRTRPRSGVGRASCSQTARPFEAWIGATGGSHSRTPPLRPSRKSGGSRSGAAAARASNWSVWQTRGTCRSGRGVRSRARAPDSDAGPRARRRDARRAGGQVERPWSRWRAESRDPTGRVRMALALARECTHSGGEDRLANDEPSSPYPHRHRRNERGGDSEWHHFGEYDRIGNTVAVLGCIRNRCVE